MAFECLTGRCPVRGEHIDDVLLATSRGERASFASLRGDMSEALGGALEAFFDRALAVDPFWRFPSAKDLTDALREASLLATRPARTKRAA